MDEKKLLDLIKNSASDLTPPDSLSPEEIEKLLTHTQSQKKKKKKRLYFARFAATAAAAAFCITAAWQVNRIQKANKELELQDITFASPQDISSEKESEKINDKAVDSESIDEGAASADTKDGDVDLANNEVADVDSSGNVVTDVDSSNTETVDADSSDAGAANADSADAGAADADSSDTGIADVDSSDTGIANVDSADTETADLDSADALTPASSYEEVFDALHEQFYYDESYFYPALGAKNAVQYEEYGVDEMAIEDSADMAYYDSAENTSGSRADSGNAEPAGDTRAVSENADGAEDAGAVSENRDMAVATAESTDEASDYSATNVQEQGVDEADIVKTDGDYMYILRQNGSVTIVRADPESMETVASISSADTAITSVQEMYLDGDTLSIIASRYETSLIQEDDTYYTSGVNQTILYTYDISDRSAPSLSGTVVQDGSYRTSRKVDDYIYLFTSYYPDIRATYEESDIVPLVNGSRLDASDFYLPEHLSTSAYLVISSVDTSRPGKILDKKALVSGVTNFYVSTENIYIANENYADDMTVTELTKFSYKDGIITGIAAGAVKGYLNNSFSMNEYGGYLRAVSTYYDDNWEEQNALYVLDESLNLAGSIEDLAEGETIRSARFFGDTGYFVTFRQTDPLFSVDLSDPSNPRILGELKVSGFSSYLHFYGENRLLGMGYEADETTGEIYGVKLSMFDISDPADVRELHRVVIPNVTWCPSLDDYKSILIDPEKNLFGFFCGERYLVFSYDEETGFVSRLVYDLVADVISRQTGIYDSKEDADFEAGVEKILSAVDAVLSASGDKTDDTDTQNTQENAADTQETQSGSDADFEISQTDSYVLDGDMLVDTVDSDAEDISYSGSRYSSMNSYNSRGLYIGDVFYLAGDASVTAFDMTEDFSKVGTLIFEE